MGTIDGMDLGRYGVWTFDFDTQPAALIRESVRELEELGWRAIWVPETVGREALSHAGFLLSVSEHLHVVNGIAQISGREARRTLGGAQLLADAYPGRHLLGLGAGFARFADLVAYLDELDTVDSPVPSPATPVRRILAAYGPRMLALARDRSAGAHTYHVTVEHTAQAREVLGPDAFLGVEHAVLFESDPAAARAIARAHLHTYLTSEYNVAKFRRLGYSDDEIEHGGSDRIVDALVFWGDLDTIVEKLAAHVDAGADHVGVQVIGIEPGRSAMPHWRRLGAALLPQTVSGAG